jgi:thioredoxin 1
MPLARTLRLPLLVAAFAAATLALPAAAESTRPASAKATASANPAVLPRLVFFMNPNGAPCQMQDQILQGMSSELKGKANVVYYKTTTPSDIAMFQRYGIRSLPLLLVTDASGKEIRRATPGIQSAAQVRQLLN